MAKLSEITKKNKMICNTLTVGSIWDGIFDFMLYWKNMGGQITPTDDYKIMLFDDAGSLSSGLEAALANQMRNALVQFGKQYGFYFQFIPCDDAILKAIFAGSVEENLPHAEVEYSREMNYEGTFTQNEKGEIKCRKTDYPSLLNT